jgi:hypothetical protein
MANSNAKTEKLAIEAAARSAVKRAYHCDAICRSLRVGNTVGLHEFDRYAEGIVIGGVSISPLKTDGGNTNTGGCDRACAELLWLSLWPGTETRIHVLTDRALADWLINQFGGANFPNRITICHYDRATGALAEVVH